MCKEMCNGCKEHAQTHNSQFIMRCEYGELMTLQTSFLSLQEFKEQQFDCPAAKRFGELHKLAKPVSMAKEITILMQ